jgi:diaminopimelate epimerase
MTSPQGDVLLVVPISVGNPHLVVLEDRLRPSERRLSELGPWLSGHPALAAGANVQIARLASKDVCEALVWERGVGRTSASGTSSCAVAAAMVATGRAAPGTLRVEMPGGALSVVVDAELGIVLRGPVEEVHSGRLSAASLATFERGA